MERKTPLYDRHVASGGKIVPYGGYLLPVQYKGVIEEHMAVRQRAGLFDVSHMGEVMVEGPGALAYLNHLLTNDFTNMRDGRVRYSPMCNESGGIVDDLLVCRLAQECYLVVVNAANRDKDVAWMKGHVTGDVSVEDVSDSWAQIALQGPKALEILTGLADANEIPEQYYTFTEHATVAGIRCLLSRTGYTGEEGFELYCGPEDAGRLWDTLLEAGTPHGLVPCGLGARDTLRLESSMPLYGHEMSDDISPLETGLGFAVKMDKEDFIGKMGILNRGQARTRVGLKVTGRGIIREECPVFLDGAQIGSTTSGTHLPYLGAAYAMAIVEKAHAAMGTAVEAEVRGRRIAAEIVPLPFYKK